VYEIQYRAKAIIARRTIEQIKPIEFEWHSDPRNMGVGFVAQQVSQVLPSTLINSLNSYPTGLNGPAGPTGAIGNSASFIPNNNISFNGPNKTVLTITGDGDVIWTGKPSEAADILVKSFQLAVENQRGITKAARRRYYWKAVDNLARKSEQMTADEFVDFVRKQAYNRETKVILDTLKGVQ
jgi:hypothetical protein